MKKEAAKCLVADLHLDLSDGFYCYLCFSHMEGAGHVSVLET